MEKEYINVIKPKKELPTDTEVLKKMTDDFWKSWIFYHLLYFYRKDDGVKIKEIIECNKEVEDTIARYITTQLKYREEYSKFGNQGFIIARGVNNDLDKKGLYDISIKHSYWHNSDSGKGEFHFECKNLTLNPKQNYISKYVYYNAKECGVYRYFNGKYAQNQNFGGMIGFVLDGDVGIIKNKIIEKLNVKFDKSPEGDLIQPIIDKAIQENDFTFNSIHNRNDSEFILHHILLDFNTTL
jgi:hypothetical protein